MRTARIGTPHHLTSSMPPPNKRKPDDINKLREKWDAFSVHWEAHYETMTLPITSTLLSWLQLDTAKDVLEVACGTGGGLKLCAFMKPQDTKLTGVDLSPAMVEKASAKVNHLPYVRVEVGNAEQLSFADCSFDRYYASLGLHLVNDASQMLGEASRVLKPGGIAAFSVWGRRGNSPQITILPETAAKIGIELPQGPPKISPFHLSADPEAFKVRVKKAGFSSCTTFYQNHACQVSSGTEFANIVTNQPPIRSALDNVLYSEEEVGTEKVENFIRAIAEWADAKIQLGNTIDLEIMIAIATK